MNKALNAPSKWHKQTYMCQEKKEEVDSWALRIAYMHQGFVQYIKTSKERQIRATSNSNDNIRTNR